MENIINYITEKLKINSKTKFVKFNPDHINDEECWICNCDHRNINFHDSVDEYCNVNDKKIYGFLLSKGNSLSNYIKKGNSQQLAYHMDIDMLLDEILEDVYNTHYEDKRICILFGRLYIETKKHASNYSKNYFIYALSEEGYDKCESYFDSIDDWRSSGSGQDLEFLEDENLFVELKQKE